MKSKRITIIGAGNLGSSIAEGLVKSKFTDPQHITITRRNAKLLEPLKAQLGIVTTSDNVQAIADSHWIILAVKPSEIRTVLEEINPHLNPKKHILVSVATGVNLHDIQSVVGVQIPLFRAMPNTAIAIQESMTCIATNNASDELQQAILAMFNALGKTFLIPERLMESATVLGACGIAYALRFIRAASQGGIEIGFEADMAIEIAAQTVRGAASLLLLNGTHPEHEIDKVTTPQGCTIAGLNEMEHQGFSSALIKGVQTSYKKIAKIREDF